jgi:TctA family transporter
VEFWDHLILGFTTALSLSNFVYCAIGVLLGTLIGVLPGIGPVAGVSMLLPITFTMPPTGALIMLSGIYYGTMFGGSTTSIIMNVPGDGSSIVTCLDGYEMAKQGRAGPALAIAALGSFFAGCVGTLLIALFGPPLAQIAFEFRSPEYFALMTLGLLMASLLGQGAPIKSVGMLLAGLLLGCVGTDVNSGLARYTFHINNLLDGIEFGAMAMGLFAIGTIITDLQSHRQGQLVTKHVGRLMPSSDDFRRSWKPVLRGTAIGGFFGILPGIGPVIASFTAYGIEKRVAKDPTRFGKGAIEGVASPEAANNMAAQCSFIPTLTLGIPGSATMALMLGALIMQGIAPGPQVIVKYPELFWGLIASMWIGNFLLVIFNLPLIAIWIRLLMVPYRWLCPAIILFCCIGAFSMNKSAFDIMIVAVFGALSFLFIKIECSPAPLLLGFILGPMVEEHLRRSLMLSRGDFSIFATRPICFVTLLVTAGLIAYTIYANVRGQKTK